ncbi:amidohydrolase family protein [Pseudorhodoferax sp.]|uniref:amidohydrolase family protein n=1 Tax=Pseudorhodoferax sp. TaxID=1993553 RepID=UPI002DD6A3C2|nr:amidohydrolase family protein [Pseudorhodoferax sp.]
MIRFNKPSAAGMAPQTLGAPAAAPQREVLHGRIVTMNAQHEVVEDGLLCLEGERIRAVVPRGGALPAGFEHIVPVRTEGTIYPGLIDLHNHLPYNYLPLWDVPKRFDNRDQWRRHALYQSTVRASFALLDQHKPYRRAMVRFAECRQLLGGTTTSQGIGTERGLYQGLLRNIEKPLAAGFQAAGGQVMDYTRATVRSKLLPALERGAPFFYHLSEGTDEGSRAHFLNLQLDDGSWAIRKNLLCIHCLGLRAEDYAQMQQAGGMVWSPTSNLLLYGKTVELAPIAARNIPIALGGDWSPSGCKNLLGELKVARAASRAQGCVLSARDLVATVTCNPARMIGWQDEIGSIQPGRRADLLVLDGVRPDAYTQLIEATEAMVRAVLIDGRVRLAESPRLALGQPQSSELLSIGGKSYTLDLAEPTGDGLGGLALSEAIMRLRHGLERPTEVAAPVAGPMAVSALPEDGDDVHLVGDMEDGAPDGFAPLDATALPLPPPMRLPPLTAVDDPDFAAAMRANRNLPDPIKALFS